MWKVPSGNEQVPLHRLEACATRSSLLAGVRNRRIEVAYLRLDLLQHPIAPIPHFCGQASPGAVFSRAFRGWVRLAIFLWVDEGAKLNDVRDRIQVERIRFAAKAQSLKRDRAATGEHIEDLWPGRTAFYDIF